MSHRILQYQFADSKTYIITLATIHLGLGLLLLAPSNTPMLAFGRPQLCLLVAITYAALYKWYGWDSFVNNMAWLGLYLLSLVYEMITIGWPASPMAITSNGAPGKGIFTDLFVQSLPYLYVGLRLAMTGLFLPVIIAQLRMSRQAP